MNNETNITDYQKAKDVVASSRLMKQVSIDVVNVKLFRKYLNDFAKLERKEFTTKQVDNQLRIIRTK